MGGNDEQKALADAHQAQAEFERGKAELTEARRKVFERVHSEGLTTRQIGEATGLHHTRISQILRGE